MGTQHGHAGPELALRCDKKAEWTTGSQQSPAPRRLQSARAHPFRRPAHRRNAIGRERDRIRLSSCTPSTGSTLIVDGRPCLLLARPRRRRLRPEPEPLGGAPRKEPRRRLAQRRGYNVGCGLCGSPQAPSCHIRRRVNRSVSTTVKLLVLDPERRLGFIERRRVAVALPAGQLEAHAPKPLAVRSTRAGKLALTD